MMKMKTKKTESKKRFPLLKIICCVLVFIGALCFFSANWYINTYGDLGFDSILYTLFSNLGGVQGGLIADFALGSLLPACIFTAVIALLLFVRAKKQLKISFFGKKEIRLFPFHRGVALVLSLAICFTTTFTAADKVRLLDYLVSNTQQTEIYDTVYVDPLTAEITFPDEKQNLIYIYLESMETTYFSKEQGGALPYNAIPELYTMAQENINFSDNDDVGGFVTANGMSWTMGALVAQSSGIPLKIPSNFADNTYGKDRFLKGAASITNVLKEEGYYQALLFGSDAAFANRDRYYLDHGIDKIYDLYTARKDGIIPHNYSVWWGMEDKYLFTYAKDILVGLSKGDKPFALTMLTVDTHHIDGYKCEYCGDQFKEQYENVMYCSSRQVYEFVEWIKEQPFFENTTVVVAGDHLTMDSGYINRNVEAGYDRHVYNCFINSKREATNTKNRVFTAMDMFPTTLAAMGCEIKGDRLGLGTNLFSATPTLAEEMGYDEFNKEISKNSGYYTVEFMMQ